jgi:hypothetical protein
MSSINMTEISSSDVSENRIESTSFGANYLFDPNGGGRQKGIGEGFYDEAAAYIGITNFRYPGGTISERFFDLANPDADQAHTDFLYGQDLDEPIVITPLAEFLAYADSVGGKVTIVVPTIRYVDAFAAPSSEAYIAAELEVRTFIQEVMNGPYAHVIDTFEIGNEFEWTDGISGSEYGKIANGFSVWIQDELDHTAFDPLISVQAGIGRSAAQNNAALAQMSSAALGAIDAVTVHTYSNNVAASNFEPHLVRNLNYANPWMTAAGRDLEVIVSEWNAQAGARNGVEFPVATAMMRVFNALAVNGMDRGHIWPVIQNTSNELVGHKIGTDGVVDDIRLSGEFYRQMISHLEGTNVVDMKDSFYTDADILADYFINAYVDEDGARAVFAVSSLQDATETLDLDLSGALDLATSYTTATVTIVSAVGDPLNQNAFGETYELDTIEFESAVVGDGQFSIELDAFDIAFIELRGDEIIPVAENNIRVHMDTTNRIGNTEDNPIEARGYANYVYGHEGNDTLNGSAEADVIHGNAGADQLTGGAGQDRFIFLNFSETGVGEGQRDVITDFDAGAGERIEIGRYDADVTLGGAQAFDFIGQSEFSNTAGELRVDQSSGFDTIVQGDINGDGVSDFEVELTGLIELSESNFLL